jgi:hypothetical protein
MQTFARLSALALVSASLFACGDDGPAKLVDSGIGNTDARPKVCAAVAAVGTMEADVTDEDKDRYIRYYADAGDVGGDPLYIYMTFRHSTAVPTLPATVDVMADAANQDFYTCTTCVYALQFDPMTFDVKKIYFQQSGSIAFTGEPVTTRHLTANFANLKLQEIEFDQSTGDMMYIPTGDCATLNATIDQDNVPNDWTCDAAKYYTAVTTPTASDCSCDCGVYDPDCRNPASATMGCTDTALPVCWPKTDPTTGEDSTQCVARPANDTCAQATVTIASPAIGTPTEVTGNTIGAGRNYNMGLNATTCTKYRQPGPDVAHKVALLAGATYTFTLSDLPQDDPNTGIDEGQDMSIALVGPGTDTVCSDNITACVAGYDEGYEGDSETFNYTVPSTGAGNYYIIVDSFNRDDAGTYKLTITRTQ